MIFVIIDSWDYYQYNYSRVTSFFNSIFYKFDYYWVYVENIEKLAIGITLSIITTLMLHMMLKDCYRHGYESYVALGIMGSVPLIIISLLLPFLKFSIGDVFMSESYVVKEPTVSTNKQYVAPHVRTAPDSMLENNYSYNQPDKIAPHSENVHVKGYWRSVPGESPNIE